MSTAPNASLADIRLQVMWNRLLSVVEEQARALVRTAFSTSAREAGDISAGVFDLEGRLLSMNALPNVHSAAYWLCARQRSRIPAMVAPPPRATSSR